MALGVAAVSAHRILRRFLKSLESGTFKKAIGRSLVRLLSARCPIDGKPLDGHSFCLLAVLSIGYDDAEEARKFADSLKEERWRECYKISTFDPGQDALQAFLIRCPEGRVFWLLRRSPVELLESDSALAVGVVSAEGIRNLELWAEELSLDWRALRSDP